ncbi:MAG: cyclic nucleotide-binding domain-containing protein, partial [Methylocystis sp.]
MFEDASHIPWVAAALSWLRGESASAHAQLAFQAFKWLEVLMSIGAAYAARMIPLRFMAMFGNMCGLAQGLGTGSLSTIVEHAVNLPLNAVRVREMRKLIATVREASATDLNVEWLKPFAHPRSLKAGATVFRKGDEADAAFILVEGSVELTEIDVVLHPGDLFGEMALFTADGRRMATAVCKTNTRLLFITYEEFEQHYFQNPEFGLYLVRLIVRRFDMNYREALGVA